MTENIRSAALSALTSVSAVLVAYTLGYCYYHVGMLLKRRGDILKKSVKAEGYLWQIYIIGGSHTVKSHKTRRGCEPARVTPHDLNNCNSFYGVYRTVADYFGKSCGNILCGTAVAGSVVGARKVVVDGFGNAYYPHVPITGLEVFGKLCDGVHGIVAAYIEEIADIIFAKQRFKLLVKTGVVLGTGELFSA